MCLVISVWLVFQSLSLYMHLSGLTLWVTLWGSESHSCFISREVAAQQCSVTSPRLPGSLWLPAPVFWLLHFVALWASDVWGVFRNLGASAQWALRNNGAVGQEERGVPTWWYPLKSSVHACWSHREWMKSLSCNVRGMSVKTSALTVAHLAILFQAN